MTQQPVAHERLDRESSSGVGYGRVMAWIGLTVVAFLPIGFGALSIANMIITEVRETVLGIGALLWAFGLVAVVAVSGTVLHLSRGVNPGPGSLIGYGLGSISTIGIVAAVRTATGSDVGFEVDHAVPQLYIPAAMFLVATTEAGRRFAGIPAARTGWNLAWAVAWVVTTALVWVTLGTSAGAPGTILATAAAAMYAAITGSMAVIGRSGGRQPEGPT